jgi:hypothetical protein
MIFALICFPARAFENDEVTSLTKFRRSFQVFQVTNFLVGERDAVTPLEPGGV